MGMGGTMLTSNELVFTFGGSYVCANFGENRSRNATVRVRTAGRLRRSSSSTFRLFTVADCPPCAAVNCRRPSLSGRFSSRRVTSAPSLAALTYSARGTIQLFATAKCHVTPSWVKRFMKQIKRLKSSLQRRGSVRVYKMADEAGGESQMYVLFCYFALYEY